MDDLQKKARNRAGNLGRLRRERERLQGSGAFAEMLRLQNGLCAICKRPMSKPCVDHDHRTDVTRSLLCSKCNTMIGMAEDDPALLRLGAEYLDGWRSR